MGLVRLAFLDFGDTGRNDVFEGVGILGDVGGVKDRPLVVVGGLDGMTGVGMGVGDLIDCFGAVFGSGNGVGVLSKAESELEVLSFAGSLMVGGFSDDLIFFLPKVEKYACGDIGSTGEIGVTVFRISSIDFSH